MNTEENVNKLQVINTEELSTKKEWATPEIFSLDTNKAMYGHGGSVDSDTTSASTS